MHNESPRANSGISVEADRVPARNWTSLATGCRRWRASGAMFPVFFPRRVGLPVILLSRPGRSRSTLRHRSSSRTPTLTGGTASPPNQVGDRASSSLFPLASTLLGSSRFRASPGSDSWIAGPAVRDPAARSVPPVSWLRLHRVAQVLGTPACCRLHHRQSGQPSTCHAGSNARCHQKPEEGPQRHP